VLLLILLLAVVAVGLAYATTEFSTARSPVYQGF